MEWLEGALNEAGRIEFPSLPLDKWTVQIDHLKALELNVTGEPLQTIVLENHAMLSGRIVRREEDPELLYPLLSDQVISLRIGEGEATLSLMKRCKPDGSFRFDFLPTGVQAELQVRSKEGTVEGQGVLAQTGSTGLTLEFDGGPRSRSVFRDDGSFVSEPIRR
ncbi:hypothetical protein Poly30_03450 [Planctomycetes bacterium Poly30]|uniref:Uncharacterized protein n=1 Tax=Saltatorellus ferox TaxID=2528018 RepID=A0A518ELC6_9BACT|nr:hypothetical protein Poly30_03450 [Planctomycetes bacterium Poly30]